VVGGVVLGVVVAAAAVEQVAGARGAIGGRLVVDERVVADPSEQDVVTRAAGEGVVAVVAEQEVVAGAAGERVVARVAEEAVFTGAAVEAVVPDVAAQFVVALGADEDVIAGVAEDPLVRSPPATRSLPSPPRRMMVPGWNADGRPASTVMESSPPKPRTMNRRMFDGPKVNCLVPTDIRIFVGWGLPLASLPAAWRRMVSPTAVPFR